MKKNNNAFMTNSNPTPAQITPNINDSMNTFTDSRQNTVCNRTLNESEFMDRFSERSTPIPNPEVKSEKMLTNLVDFFHKVLLCFDREEMKVKSKALPEL